MSPFSFFSSVHISERIEAFREAEKHLFEFAKTRFAQHQSKAMVDGYILNRLPAIDCPEQRKHLSEYLYQNSMLPGSGECCLSEILTAGAFAKIPLVHRIPDIVQTAEVMGWKCT